MTDSSPDDPPGSGTAGHTPVDAAAPATSSESPAPRADRTRPTWLTPLSVLATGLVVTAALAWWVRGLHRAGGEAAFRDDASHAVAHARERLARADAATDSLAAFLRMRDRVDPAEFDAIAENLVKSHSAVKALAWVPLASTRDLPAVEALMKARTPETARVWEPGPGDAGVPVAPRDLYAPVAIVYPPALHRAILGLDLLAAVPADSPFRASLLSRRHGAWGSVALSWQPDSPSALFIFTSVDATPDATPGQPSLSGVAVGVVPLDQIVTSSAEEPAHIDVALTVASPAPTSFMGVPHPAAAPGAATASPLPAPMSSLVQEEVLEVAGSPLTIRAVGDERRYFAGETNVTWLVLGAGTLVSILLAGVVGSRAAKVRAASQVAAQARELEHANVSLRESEQRYRLAAEVVDGIVYDWDAAANQFRRSNGLFAVLGYHPDELESTADAWLALVHPDDSENVRRQFNDAVRRHDGFNLQYRARHRDGRYVELWDRGAVVRHPDGSVRRVIGCVISLAEKRQAEQAVREANERFALFADAINDVLWTVDRNPLRVVYLNPAFERVWGMPREAVYANPEAWLAAVHPDDRQRVSVAWRSWAEPNAPREHRLSYRITRADGQTRWIQDTGVRLDDAQGHPYRVVGVAEDITDRKLAEIDLQESERAYRQLFDANRANKIVFDPADGRIVQANAAAVQFYGYPREQLESMNVFDLCACEPEEVRQKLVGGLASTPYMESRHRLASNEIREVEIFSSPIELRGRTLVYSLILDISERKKVEAALAESRRTLEQAQAVGRIGSWVSDASPEGRLLWSSQVFRIFGIEPEAFDQQISTFFQMVHPDDVAAVRDAVGAAIRDHTVYQIDHRIIRPDGEVRWVHEQGEVEYDPADKPLRVIGVVQDITERHHAEQAVRNSQERLLATVESLAEGCIVLDPSGTLVDCNAAAPEILGLTREQLNGKTAFALPWEVINEDGTPASPERFAAVRCLRTGEPINDVVNGFRRPDGQIRWLSANARPIRNTDGSIASVVVSFIDFTERRAAAAALRETAHKYRLLFDANPEPLWVYDIQTLRFLAVNRATVATYGYSTEEFLSMTLLDIRPPSEHERLRRHTSLLSDAERLSGTWLHRLRDGRLIEVEIISHPIEFEGRQARIVLAKDVTERLRAERALRESEACLRDAQRIGEFGDWEYDFTSGRITWSDQVYRLFRRDPALGPPNFEENMSFYFPEDRARLVQAVRDAAEHGRESDMDLQLHLPTGEDVWHRGVINVVRDAGGKVVRLKGVVQDITARKRAEHALRATQLRLATILEHLPDVVVYEADRHRIFPSDNILSLVGYPAAVFEKDRAAFIRLIHPADLKDAETRIEALLSDRHSDALVLQYRLRHRDGHYLWVEDRMIFERPAPGRDRLLGVLIDISDRKRSEQRQRFMMAELDHRVKNNLATVISLLQQTGRTTGSKQEFEKTLLGRLQALSRMHTALSRTHWEGVGLRALVAQTLEAYQSSPPGRVEITGEDVTLSARAASAVAMALHELATNAGKYGSLSVPEGRVSVQWTLNKEPSGSPHIALRWTESDGPPVVPPATTGFGTELIQGGIAYELHGSAHIAFNPTGVCCTMTIPLEIAPPAPLPVDLPV